MLKFFSFGKNQAGVLITLLALISLGACYFFIYLPNNEKAVQERRFRCLRKIDTNIRIKIDNSFTQISNLIYDYDKNHPVDTSNHHKKNHSKDSIARKKDSLFRELNTYISEYPKDNFTLLMPEQANKYFHNSKLPIYIGDDTTGKFRFYIDVSSQFTLLVNKIKSDNKVSKSGNNKDAKSNNKTDPIDYSATISDTTIGIRFEFVQFFKPLLPPDVFDYYVVFVKNKKLYESFPSGLNYNYKDADSLLNVQRKITSPGVHTLKIGETDYRAFSHPAYTYTDSKWIITGLVSDSNYQKEKNQLPLWAFLLLLTSVIIMLVSLPWIKLYHMGNKDRLTI
ncbi:MAG TPA: hypothetical protein VHZ50_10995, partial [Puia sp.]|nr:hypothetical protein [Puia sp.]